MGLKVFKDKKYGMFEENNYINTDILMSELHSDSTWACPDHCIYDAGHSCSGCERLEHTLFWKKKKLLKQGKKFNYPE